MIYARLLYAAATAFVACQGCSAAQSKILRDASGALCQVVVQATDPSLVPMCATVNELEIAIGYLVSNHKAATAHEVATYLPSNDEIYSTILKLRGEK